MIDDTSNDHIPHHGRNRGGSNVSSTVRKLSQEFEDSRPPEGFMAVTGEIASTITAECAGKGLAPETETDEDRTQTAEPTRERASSFEKARQSDMGATPVTSSDDAALTVQAFNDRRGPEDTEPFENGYHFPPKYPWQEATRHGLLAFWKFFITPMGFFWTIYGLNVVAWGGMIFLLLCNAAPAMCAPTCDHIDSPRLLWIEWDAQILTGLFCVTAFGFVPWRFRDLYLLLKYRVLKNHDGLRRLAGIHSSWFRLPGSQELALDVGPGNIPDDIPKAFVPIPEKNIANPPLTGRRAPATAVWKMDFMIWCMVWNTLAQVGLCGIMWGMNRYNRPSWATGLLVAVACIIAVVGGLVIFLEGRKVKSIEGVPLTERDLERLARDKELGIPHYNNFGDKKPKKKDRDPERGEK
ncbi:hypothetical protein MFIFM68171_10633 [Madurella fahalii]|uniref:Alpha-l-rhamnosidase c n=1 Tax=Madurella fahalii TaxID=1157608 RepID=A0ABQ0GRP9_9PEZI